MLFSRYQRSVFNSQGHCHSEVETQDAGSQSENPSSDFVPVPVFPRNIVLGNLRRRHFALIRVFGIFDAANGFSFEVLTFLLQLRNALGIHVLLARQPLGVAGLSARCRAQTAAPPDRNRVRGFLLCSRASFFAADRFLFRCRLLLEGRSFSAANFLFARRFFLGHGESLSNAHRRNNRRRGGLPVHTRGGGM